MSEELQNIRILVLVPPLPFLQVCDLSLLTVDDDEFWAAELMALQFVDVPQLQCVPNYLRSLFCSVNDARKD